MKSVNRKARLRERGQWAPISSITETAHVLPSGAISYPFTGQIRDSAIDYEIMNDYVVEDFKKLQSEGNVVFNSLDQRRIITTGGSQGGRVVVISGGATGTSYTCNGHWLSYLLRASSARKRIDHEGNLRAVLTGISDNDMSRALAEASTKANGLPSDSQLLVTIAEFRQAVRLLPDILKSFNRMLTKINSTYYRYSKGWVKGGAIASNLKAEADFLQDLWLATRYGIRPTLADAMGMYKAVQRLRDIEIDRHTSRGVSSIDGSGSSTGLLSYGITRTPVLEQTSDTYTVRAMSIWAAKLALTDRLGLNLANVPLAVVDLIPFSFVLNWMVNINDFALAMGSAVQPGWEKLGGCWVGRRETSTLYQTTGPSTIVAGYPQYAVDRSFEGNVVAIERHVRRIPGLPAPSITVRSQPFRWLTDARVIDAVLLSKQQMRGRGVSRLITLGV
jgi:hypothetical protein